MSLLDLASLGSFVSGLAVLVSLVFLYFQLRQISTQVKQAEKNQQATIRQNRTVHVSDMQMMLTDAKVAEAVSKGDRGNEDITATQLEQYSRYCRAIFLDAEDSFYQHAEGLLSDSAYATYVGGLRRGFSFPGYRAMWDRNRATFPHEFARFIDKLKAATPVASDNERLQHWLADINAEKAKAHETAPGSPPRAGGEELISSSSR